MTTRRMVQLKDILTALRGRLLIEIADTLRLAPEGAPLDDHDILNRAGRVQDEEHTSPAIRLKTAMVQRVDEALARLSTGAFGMCASCGQEIDEKRLAAVPFAPRCHACQEHAEAHPPTETDASL